MITEKATRATAKELNEVLGLDPAIDTKAKLPIVIDGIKSALPLIDPKNDEFSDATQAVIDEMNDGGEEEEEEVEAPKKKGKVKAAPVEEEEAEEEEAEEEAEEDSLEDQINAAPLKLSALTAIVKANAEFKPLVKKLATFEKASILKAAMLELITPEEEEEEEVVLPKGKKATTKKAPPADDDEEEDEDAPKGKKKTPFVGRTDKSGKRYTRVMAMAETLKDKPDMKMDIAVSKADALFTKKTGAPANPKETKNQYLKVLQVLQALDLA